MSPWHFPLSRKSPYFKMGNLRASAHFSDFICIRISQEPPIFWSRGCSLSPRLCIPNQHPGICCQSVAQSHTTRVRPPFLPYFQLFRFIIAWCELFPISWGLGMYEVNKAEKEKSNTWASKSNVSGGSVEWWGDRPKARQTEWQAGMSGSRWSILPCSAKPTTNLPVPPYSPPSSESWASPPQRSPTPVFSPAQEWIITSWPSWEELNRHQEVG